MFKGANLEKLEKYGKLGKIALIVVAILCGLSFAFALAKGGAFWILPLVFGGLLAFVIIMRKKLAGAIAEATKGKDLNDSLETLNQATGYAKAFIEKRTAQKIIANPLSEKDPPFTNEDYKQYVNWLNLIGDIVNDNLGTALTTWNNFFPYSNEELLTKSRTRLMKKWLVDLIDPDVQLSRSDLNKPFEVNARLLLWDIDRNELSSARKNSVIEFFIRTFENEPKLFEIFDNSGSKTSVIESLIQTGLRLDYSATDYTSEIGAFYRNPALYARPITEDDEKGVIEFSYLVKLFAWLHDERIPWRNELIRNGAYLPAGFKEEMTNGDENKETVFRFLEKHYNDGADYVSDLLDFNNNFFGDYLEEVKKEREGLVDDEEE